MYAVANNLIDYSLAKLKSIINLKH